ncbi:uncharacterized protein LODBEIA_P14270 [Lodderomyces beijingensis]|uniref:phospholipase D n=1 Tax=Lodderomyces beijingensis TaxID=1775926 RepID=A0ABP0ZHU8_9ASCO
MDTPTSTSTPPRSSSPQASGSQGTQHQPLRESNDIGKLIKSVSGGDQPQDKQPKHRHNIRKNALYSDESPKIIGNPLSFYSQFSDPMESRYHSDEEEQESNAAYDPELDNNNIVSELEGPRGPPGPEQGYGRSAPQPPHEDLQHQESATSQQNGSQSHDENKVPSPAAAASEQQGARRSETSTPRTRVPFSHTQTFTSFLPSMFSRPGQNQDDTGAEFSTPTQEQPQQQQQQHQYFGDANKHEPNRYQRIKNKLRLRKQRERRKPSYFAHDELHDETEKARRDRASKLISNLSLGGPAISLMGVCLLEDEKGIARAPLLLALLGLRVSDVSSSDTVANRRFRIDLEYGVGIERMSWSIERTSRELAMLYYRLRVQNWLKDLSGKKITIPKYPMPPMKRLEKGKTTSSRLKNVIGDSQSQSRVPANTNANAIDNDNESVNSNRSGVSRLTRVRSCIGSITSAVSRDRRERDHLIQSGGGNRNQTYVKEVEVYLNELSDLVDLAPQSNILFAFFEISPLSALLSYESGYQGKQGGIHISGTAKGQGWRVGHFKADDLKGMYDRRSDKWMLIRHSYITYVSNINSTTPLEVFLVDSDLKITSKGTQLLEDDGNDFDANSVNQKDLQEIQKKEHSQIFAHLKITLENRERKLVINPRSRDYVSWLDSLKQMQHNTEWSQKHRFDSFAPERSNCFAQWFVDGRDYFWAVSSAMEMAKQTIFIHDWWLSPELYLRRPANGNQQYRIDRLLQRKAKEGVKIYVIIYRNVGTTVATDSLYTKHSLLSLDEENIHVIRSPNQLLQNTYFWAHHEKLCIVDQTYAFLGGIDLCYGRYDTPDHALTDDSHFDFEHLSSEEELTKEKYLEFQTFPGKDYSNPRAKDFFELEKPYQSMYNRQTTPRMPWHDIHMSSYGKIARDLSRHFVQRWNYLIRQKRPSRFTPLLIPPPDFLDEEAEKHGFQGSCNVQLLRSAGNWSLGLKEHEQSIQNAYLKLIETSEHFVYIENQFFITSCVIDGVEIKNKIGDALVDRIIRAHREGTNWKAIVIIPLMPGFEAQVDQPEGSSVRVIMQCQYMSISRGESSIYAKLRMRGINPEDYIQFFSLRKWGKIGPKRTLITEQLYIHAKCMIVDDTSVIIGSANINERSMRGLRDSEVAAVVQDQERIDTKMDGKPFKAAKFAHSLRMRLMREHLGIALDVLDVVERRFQRIQEFAETSEGLKHATTKFTVPEYRRLSAMVEIASRDVLNQREGTERWKRYCELSQLDEEIGNFDYVEEQSDLPPPLFLPISFNNRTGPYEANKGVRDKKKHSYDNRVQNSVEHKRDVYGNGIDKYRSTLAAQARVTSGEFLKSLSLEVMESMSPKTAFIPDVESVKQFLESDDSLIVEDMDEESQRIINERNEERWLLLKKISYLQRVASREEKFAGHENKKRCEAGLEPNPSSSKELFEGDTSGTNIVDGITSSDGVGSDYAKDKSQATVTLTDSAVKELIDGMSLPEAKVSNYVDPYDFEDPIDSVFYEYVWNEHARRNTELFRMVFHSQPDDAVSRWSEYTNFSKLQSSFMKAQDADAFARTFSNPKSGSDENKLEASEMKSANNVVRETPDRGAAEERQARGGGGAAEEIEDYGLLGKVPPSKEHSKSTENAGKKRNKLARRMSAIAGNVEQKIDERLESSESEGEEEEEEVADGARRNSLMDERDEEPVANGGPEATPNGFIPTSQQSHLGQPASGDDTTTAFNNVENDFSTTAVEEKIDQRNSSNGESQQHVKKNRGGAFLTRRKIQSGEAVYDKATAEKFLDAIQGHLVYFPTEWLSTELKNNNWFYNTDRLPPMEIYD